MRSTYCPQHKTTPADNKTNFFWSEAHNAYLDLLVFIMETKLWNKRRSGPMQSHEVDLLLPMITRAQVDKDYTPPVKVVKPVVKPVVLPVVEPCIHAEHGGKCAVVKPVVVPVEETV